MTGPRASAEGTSHPPALVFGNAVTALGVVRSLVAAGVTPYVPTRADDVLAASRWYRPAPRNGGAAATDFEGILRDVQLDRAVLFPCSDSWSMAVAKANRCEEMAGRFPASVSAPEVLRLVQDKSLFAEWLRQHEVPHPPTWLLETPDDLAGIDLGRYDSIFLKPVDSQSFFARYGVKAQMIGSRQEAGAALRRFLGDGFSMVVQEYVPGPPSRHVFIDGFVDRFGQVRALFARRRLRMYPADFGNSSCMRSVALSEVAPAAETMRRLLVELGYRGIFSAEFKQDERDGSYRLIEVNGRAWWYVEFAQRCGVDVCRMAYEDALGREVRGVADYAVGKRCVYPYYDYSARRHGPEAGRASRLATVLGWLGAYQPVFRWADPWPAMKRTGGILAGAAAKRLALLRGSRLLGGEAAERPTAG